MQLDVGLDKTHIGLLVINDERNTKIDINLGQHSSREKLSAAIGTISRDQRRRPNMTHALKVAQDKVTKFTTDFRCVFYNP